MTCSANDDSHDRRKPLHSEKDLTVSITPYKYMKKAIQLLLLILVLGLGGYYCTRPPYLGPYYHPDYVDAPHPFNDPSYPVRCSDVPRDEAGNYLFTLQQGATLLRIPDDAVTHIYKRSDAETCEPQKIELYYEWQDTSYGWPEPRLLRAASINDCEACATKISMAKVGVTVTLLDTLRSPEDTKAHYLTPNKFAEAKRYTPAYRHEFLPLWYYPNFRYEHFEGKESPYTGDGFGIVGTIDPRTGYPAEADCTIRISNDELTENNQYNPEAMIKSPVPNDGGSRCKTALTVLQGDTALRVSVNAYPNVAPDLDKVYHAVDAVIKSYIVEQ